MAHLVGNQSKFDAFLQVSVSCKVIRNAMAGGQGTAGPWEGQAERVAGERKKRWETRMLIGG